MPSADHPESESEPFHIASAILQTLHDGSTALMATLIESANDEARIGAKLLIRRSAESNKSEGSLGNEKLDRAVLDQAANIFGSNIETRVFQVKEFAPA